MSLALKLLAADIFLVEELLEPSLCSHVIQVADCSEFEPAKVALKGLDNQTGDHEVLYLAENNSLLRSTNELLLPKIGAIQTLLFKHYGVSFPHVETCVLSRFHPGRSYKLHVDNMLLSNRLEEAAQGVLTRDVSLIGFLNADFEGGEILFNRQNLKVKPIAGAVLVFPSCYTHPQQSLPVTKGRKYTFTTWMLH